MTRHGAAHTGRWQIAFGLGLLLLPAAAPAQQAYPAPGASYSAAVVSAPGATLAVLGGIAGAVIGGLIGGVAGGEAGAALGDKLDQTFLDNLQCLDCGHAFRIDTD